MLSRISVVWIIIGVFVAGMVVAGNLRTRQETVSSGVSFGQKTFTPQTDSQAEVTVEVTPKFLEAGKEAIFQVTFNTHSVELDKDLAQVSVLVDDHGEKYKALLWTGGTGGHHLSGDLTFPKISDQAKSVELQISSIGGVEKVFRWTL